MISIVAQQDFLPTDLVIEIPFLLYCFPGAFIVIGLLLFFRADRVMSGALFVLAGIFGIVLYLFMSGNPIHKQNIENLKTNIQTVYDVDDVTTLDKEIKNGDIIKIKDEERSFEVVVNWDPETYKPTIAPTTATVEEIAELEK